MQDSVADSVARFWSTALVLSTVEEPSPDLTITINNTHNITVMVSETEKLKTDKKGGLINPE